LYTISNILYIFLLISSFYPSKILSKRMSTDHKVSDTGMVETNSSTVIEDEVLQAVLHGDNSKLCTFLADGYDPNHKFSHVNPDSPYYGVTAMHILICQDNSHGLQQCLDANADVNIKEDKYGMYLIHTASLNDSPVCLQLLLTAGADPSVKTEDVGENALWIASAANSSACVQLLLHIGIDPNQSSTTISLETPLMAASWRTHTTCVALLLQNGANPNTKNNDGQTALYKTSSYGQPRHITCIQLLLKGGADPNIQEYEFKFTALHIASQNGNINVVKWLLKYDANIHLQSNCGYTPLHLAARYGHVDICKILVNYHADIDIHDIWHHTALSLAITHHHTEVVTYLTDCKHILTTSFKRARVETDHDTDDHDISPEEQPNHKVIEEEEEEEEEEDLS
jgi:ankyrin repeat protein